MSEKMQIITGICRSLLRHVGEVLVIQRAWTLGYMLSAIGDMLLHIEINSGKECSLDVQIERTSSILLSRDWFLMDRIPLTDWGSKIQWALIPLLEKYWILSSIPDPMPHLLSSGWEPLISSVAFHESFHQMSSWRAGQYHNERLTH